jgi:hypothetical protein
MFCPSIREAEMQHVAILDDILLAFQRDSIAVVREAQGQWLWLQHRSALPPGG